jgi:hypothetical protein
MKVLRSAPATGPPAGHQRRGSAEGYRPSASRGSRPPTWHGGAIVNKNKKDTETQTFYFYQGLHLNPQKGVRWALHGKGGVRHAATNWVKQCGASTMCRPLESTDGPSNSPSTRLSQLTLLFISHKLEDASVISWK